MNEQIQNHMKQAKHKSTLQIVHYGIRLQHQRLWFRVDLRLTSALIVEPIWEASNDKKFKIVHGNIVFGIILAIFASGPLNEEEE